MLIFTRKSAQTWPIEPDPVKETSGPSTLTESSRDKLVGVGDALTDDVICNSISCKRHSWYNTSLLWSQFGSLSSAEQFIIFTYRWSVHSFKDSLSGALYDKHQHKTNDNIQSQVFDNKIKILIHLFTQLILQHCNLLLACFNFNFFHLELVFQQNLLK